MSWVDANNELGGGGGGNRANSGPNKVIIYPYGIAGGFKDF